MALEIAIQGDTNREYGVFKKFNGATDCLGIIVCDNTFYLVVRLFLDFTSIRGPYATILESDDPTRSVVGVMVSQFPRRNVAIGLASQGGTDCIQIIVYIEAKDKETQPTQDDTSVADKFDAMPERVITTRKYINK